MASHVFDPVNEPRVHSIGREVCATSSPVPPVSFINRLSDVDVEHNVGLREHPLHTAAIFLVEGGEMDVGPFLSRACQQDAVFRVRTPVRPGRAMQAYLRQITGFEDRLVESISLDAHLEAVAIPTPHRQQLAVAHKANKASLSTCPRHRHQLKGVHVHIAVAHRGLEQNLWMSWTGTPPSSLTLHPSFDAPISKGRRAHGR